MNCKPGDFAFVTRVAARVVNQHTGEWKPLPHIGTPVRVVSVADTDGVPIWKLEETIEYKATFGDGCFCSCTITGVADHALTPNNPDLESTEESAEAMRRITSIPSEVTA